MLDAGAEKTASPIASLCHGNNPVPADPSFAQGVLWGLVGIVTHCDQSNVLLLRRRVERLREGKCLLKVTQNIRAASRTTLKEVLLPVHSALISLRSQFSMVKASEGNIYM